MKYQILNTFESLPNASTEKQATHHIQKLGDLIKNQLIQSLKNAIEVGEKKQPSSPRKK